MGSRTVKVVKIIAERVGEVFDVDKIDKIGWDRFMKVRVKLDVRKSIKRIQKIKNKWGEDCWVRIKYETFIDLLLYML